MKKKITSSRNRTHGDPIENLSLARKLKEVLATGSHYNKMSLAEREALDMVMTKSSRIVCGLPLLEHWEDIIGYSAIGGEANTSKRK